MARRSNSPASQELSNIRPACQYAEAPRLSRQEIHVDMAPAGPFPSLAPKTRLRVRHPCQTSSTRYGYPASSDNPTGLILLPDLDLFSATKYFAATHRNPECENLNETQESRLTPDINIQPNYPRQQYDPALRHHEKVQSFAKKFASDYFPTLTTFRITRRSARILFSAFSCCWRCST